MEKNRFIKKALNATDFYIFDKWIFQIFMFVVFIGLFTYLYFNNFDLNYYSCEGNYNNPIESCKNPFYTPVNWKNSEYLIPGEYGKKPTFFFKAIPFIVTFSFIFLLILNHIIYNKHIKIGEFIGKNID